MAKIDKTYFSILNAIKDSGYIYKTDNRPDVEMKQISSINIEHSLLEFPALTTKEVWFTGVFAELIWFLRGDTNIKFLVDNGVGIWNQDAHNFEKRNFPNQVDLGLSEFIEGVKEGTNSGDVGRNYGVQWRRWTAFEENVELHDKNYPDTFERVPFDQIQGLIDNLRKPNPISRRHIVTAWNPAEIDQTALPPCHWSFEILPRPMSTQQKMIYSGGDMEYLNTLWDQAYLKNDKEAEGLLKREISGVPEYGFTLKWHQRSVDTFLGLPFNIASYAVLSHIIGALTGLVPLSIIGDLSNVHVYGNHWDAVSKQLGNNPSAFAAPKLKISDNLQELINDFRKGVINFNDFVQSLSVDDMWLDEYNNFGKISAKMVAPVK